MSTFRIYRRALPHWREEGRTYFVTWRVHPRQPELSAEERTVVADTLSHFHKHKYRLHAFVVMNDHMHLLVSPFPEHTLEGLVGSWKSYTTRRFWSTSGRQGEVWQREYFDRIVRDEEEFIEKARYIQQNPFKRWPELKEYPWQEFEAD